MTDLSDLRAHVRGPVLLPGEEGFDAARRPWNIAVDQPVAAVVEAANAEDVRALVVFAGDTGHTVTTQAAGHGAVGDTEGVILLRTSRLSELTVRPDARSARVGAGVQWGALQSAAGAYDLTGLAGSSPVVSVTGYTLGGGLGWFARAHGWAADSVTAFDVVSAQGEAVRVTQESDPDLFWALRGGGGDFGIVTAMEFNLHPAPALRGGRMVWPAELAPAVLEAFREVTADAPENLATWLTFLTVPGGPAVVEVDIAYLGTTARGQELLKPFERVGTPSSDSRSSIAVADLGSIAAEPTDPSPGVSQAELLTDLRESTVKTLLEHPVSPLLSIQLRHLGGAIARTSDSPHGALSEQYCLYMFGVPGMPENAAAIRETQAKLRSALAEQVTGRKPFTMLTQGETPAAAFPPAALERLRAVKHARDPRTVFRSNYPVGATMTPGR